VRKNFLSYGHQWIDDDDIKSVVDVLKSDWITQGSKIKEFEELVAKYCNAKYAVAFSSGTAALHASLNGFYNLEGYEVITSPISFISSSNCILYNCGIVKFADIKPDTYNINYQNIKKQITSKTKAIIPVDFAGQPCDLDEVKEIANDNNLIVIEDACHALGAEYKNKKIGNISDLTVFSFHPVKAITTGEGGMVLTNNYEYYEKLLLFRTHGITKNPNEMHRNDGEWYYEMHNLGYNYRITDFQCALGISQLKKLDKFIKRRREIAKIYNQEFESIDEITIPYEKYNVKSAYHLYVVQFDLKVDKKTLFNLFRKENIGVQVHYIPIHLQPFYQHLYNFQKGDFPIAENYYKKALTLPLFPKMNDVDVENVIDVVKKIIKNKN